MTRKVWIFTALLSALLFSPLSYAVVSNLNTQTVTATGTGSTTNYTIGFDFRDNSWITVTLVDNTTGAKTSITYGAGAGKFTITGGNPGTTVVMGTAPSTNEHLIIGRSIPLTQPVNYDPLSAFPASDHMKQMDTFAMELQNLSSAVTGISVPVSSIPTFPTGAGYTLLGWDSLGSTLVNYGAGASSGDVLQFNGSTWTHASFTYPGIMTGLNGQTGLLAPAVGGTGVANNGLLTWGTHALTFNLAADTSVTLPSSGTLVAGTVNSSNSNNTIVGRDGSGNFAANQITANSFVGPLTGSVTGNVTGNISGTSSNITGTVAIGHGGTGATTQQTAINALVGAQVSGQVLHSDGTNASMAALVPADMPANIPRTKLLQSTANTLAINDSSGNLAPLVGGASGNVATFNGLSWVSAPAGSGIPGIFPYGADSGAANAYVVAAPNPPIIGYAAGIGLSFVAGNTNTGASTVDISSLGPQAIKHADGTDLAAGDIFAGQLVLIEYDGTNFQLMNPLTVQTGAVTVTASASPTTAQSSIIANCVANCTITLPVISSVPRTYNFDLKNIATTQVTIQGTGGDLIDGAASAVLNFQWQAVTLKPTSSGWLIQ